METGFEVLTLLHLLNLRFWKYKWLPPTSCFFFPVHWTQCFTHASKTLSCVLRPLLFGDKVSLSCPGWPWTSYISQAGLDLWSSFLSLLSSCGYNPALPPQLRNKFCWAHIPNMIIFSVGVCSKIPAFTELELVEEKNKDQIDLWENYNLWMFQPERSRLGRCYLACAFMSRCRTALY